MEPMSRQPKFYMDVHIPKAITNGLRLRGVDVLMAQEDKTTETPDRILLERATALERIIVTFDVDFLTLAADCHVQRKHFAGIVFARARSISDRQCIDDLELIAKAGNAYDYENNIEFLPLR